MFNPNFFACLRVFHLVLEHVFLAQRHCDCRRAEFAVECLLLDQSLNGVADSPAAGMAGRVAAGAGWPGRTEILRFRRWVWVCHLGAPFRCAHRLAHRKRAHGQRGLRVGASLPGRNLDGNQIAWKYRTCAGHADLLFRDGGKRQAGKCDCLLECTFRPELTLRIARESGHNSMCQNGLKVLLRATVRTKKRDSSAISSGVAALKSAVSTPVRDCPGLLAK